MASGRFLGDALTTRWGMKTILQFSGLFTAAGLLLAVFLPNVPTATIGFMLVGAGVSSVVPLVYSAAGRSKILSPGVAIAAVSTFGYTGFLFGLGSSALSRSYTICGSLSHLSHCWRWLSSDWPA